MRKEKRDMRMRKGRKQSESERGKKEWYETMKKIPKPK